MDVDKKAIRNKARKASTSKQKGWLTQEQMAASCDISTAGFQNWNVDPIEKIGRYTYYRVVDVLANRLAKQEERLQKTAESASDQELTRAELEASLGLTRARVEYQEIKNAQLRKELAPVQLIEWVLGKAAGQISAILESIPMNLKKRNPRLTASNIEFITREIVKTQNIAARMKLDLDEYDERNTGSYP